MGAQLSGRLGDGEILCQTIIDHGPQPAGQRPIARSLDRGPQVGPNQVAQSEDAALGGDDVGRIGQRRVDAVDGGDDGRTKQRGGLGGGIDGGLGQPLGLEVEDALAERPIRFRRASVVGHLRRQQGDAGGSRQVVVPVEIVGHGTVVDEQDRPRVMRMSRVGMMLETGVEDLLHQGHLRVPRADPIGHVTNVQDPGREENQSGGMHETTTSPAQPATPVRFDTKVVVVLRDDLLPWQELNVTAFLMSGIATSAEDLVGQNYRDGDGNDYLPMLRQPVLVMSADAEVLAKARTKALGRGMPLAVYTEDLFATGHDAANRAAVAAWPPRTSTWWGSLCGVRRTPSTERSKVRGCTSEEGL